MPEVQAGPVRLYYQQTGRGPDVVLIHAATSNLAAWVFTGLMEAIGHEFRVTAYDLRGHGHSETPATGYTSADMAADFARLHDRLGLGPAVLVGHSFGGVVAMHAAVEYPDRVRAVILSDSFFPGLPDVEPDFRRADVWTDLRAKFASAGLDLPADMDMAELFRVARGVDPAGWDRLQAAMGAFGRGWLRALPRLADTTCGDDLFAVAGLTAARIESVRQPVVALYDEFSSFLATYRYLAARLPACTAEIIPGAKHLALIQNAATFTAAVRRHLRDIHAADSGPGDSHSPPTSEREV